MPIILVALALIVPFQPFSLRTGLAANATPGAVLSPTNTPEPAPPTATATAVTTAAPTSTSTAEASATSTATTAPSPVKEPTPPRHYVVLIVIDAARPSYLALTRLPHIQALMQDGTVYDRAWVGELESSTPGVHVTLGTGTLPRENGFLGFSWIDPATGKTTDFRTLLADRAIDPVLNNLPVPSVAARLHQFIPNAVSIAASGHKDYAVVGLGGGAADYEVYGKFQGAKLVPTFMHSPPPLAAAKLQALTVTNGQATGAEDAFGFNYAITVARKTRPHLLMINVPEMDTRGHWVGPNDHNTFTVLAQNIDNQIGRLEDAYRQMGILDRTDFIITADHAMVESLPARNWGLVRTAATAAGADVLRADGAGGAVWLQNPTQAKVVADKLVSMHPAHVEAVFYRSRPGTSYEYLRASPMSWLVKPQVSQALSYLADTTAGAHGPDLWVLYRENYTTIPLNVAGKWRGTHGGATWKVQHIPMIISGPGIKRGFHSQFPARAIDIAPTMERLLGLPAIHRDGVLLADALSNPMTGELRPQQAVAPDLSADVDALQAQSRADQRLQSNWVPLPLPIIRCPPHSTRDCTTGHAKRAAPPSSVKQTPTNG